MTSKRTVANSLTHMTELVLPQHANRVGTAFGGSIMSWIDICASIVASRHAGQIAVTAAVDELVFLNPIRIGDVVELTGHINAAFNTSMEIEVVVHVEDAGVIKGSRRRSVEAFLTFVALDGKGQPSRVPGLECISAEERAREQEAIARRNQRLMRRKNA